jgi:divalent metal cation (Fe/Co/Zn/Cd) transporter
MLTATRIAEVAIEVAARSGPDVQGFDEDALSAAIVIWQLRELAGQDDSEKSTTGLAVAAAALAVMSLLAIRKKRGGRLPGSRALAADTAETALASAALAGAGVDTWPGWWWTGPAAGVHP